MSGVVRRRVPRRVWRGLANDRGGSAGIEAAIVLALLGVPLLSLLVVAGLGVQLQTRVDRAMHAGLLYAWGTGSTLTTSGFTAAATNAYGGGRQPLTASATLACYCITATGTRAGQTAVACTTTCSGSTILARYLTGSLSTTFTPIFGTGWGVASYTLSASSTVRVSP